MKKVSFSIDVRFIERKDRGYFQNYKMFNKKIMNKENELLQTVNKSECFNRRSFN